MKYDFDIIILGAGSGGLVVASAASSMGARVMLVESRKMGGDCLNYGCVPSKTFLKSSHLAREMNNAYKYGILNTSFEVSLEEIMNRVASVIKEIEPHDSKQRYESLGVDVKLGYGKIVSQNEVMVDNKKYSAKKIVIATGSKANIPGIEGLSTVEYYTNETIFNLKKLPGKLVILGGGPIGLELGQGFANLGSNVHIIDNSDDIFKKDEPEVSNIMKQVFDKEGIKLHLKSEIKKVTQKEGDIVVSILSNGEPKEIACDTLLVSLGRTPNTSHIGLDEVGVETDKRGFVKVNEYLQTSIANIYACGDCIGNFMFTHAASYEASIIVRNALIAKMFKTNYYNMPWTTYTAPEVAHIGYLERDAKEKNILGSVYTLPISQNDRAKAEDDRDGFIKVILDKKKYVIGATIVGNKAGEMIATLSVLITHKLKLSKLMSVIYQYPIQGEILKSLALMDFKDSAKPWQKKLLQKVVRR